MFGNWFRRKAVEAIRLEAVNFVQEMRASLEKESHRYFRGITGTDDNQIVAGPGGDHVILDFECQEPEVVSGWFNVAEMQDGEAIKIDLDVRWTDGTLVRYWDGKEIGGLQETPLYDFQPLVCPRGARIVIHHVSGGPIPIKYYLVRRSP